MMCLKMAKPGKAGEVRKMEEEEDVPFGPPPEYYNYRCSRCQFECEIDEAIIDTAIMWAEDDGEYYEGFMPVLHCLSCHQETLEYVRD